jgi:hypothetical protein
MVFFVPIDKGIGELCLVDHFYKKESYFNFLLFVQISNLTP